MAHLTGAAVRWIEPPHRLAFQSKLLAMLAHAGSVPALAVAGWLAGQTGLVPRWVLPSHLTGLPVRLVEPAQRLAFQAKLLAMLAGAKSVPAQVVAGWLAGQAGLAPRWARLAQLLLPQLQVRT